MFGIMWEEARKAVHKKTKQHSIRPIAGRTKIKQEVIHRMIMEDGPVPDKLVEELRPHIDLSKYQDKVLDAPVLASPVEKKKRRSKKSAPQETSQEKLQEPEYQTIGVAKGKPEGRSVVIENRLDESIVITVENGKIIINSDQKIRGGQHIFGKRCRYQESPDKREYQYDSRKIPV